MSPPLEPASSKKRTLITKTPKEEKEEKKKGSPRTHADAHGRVPFPRAFFGA
jgi:hypothetical protein